MLEGEAVGGMMVRMNPHVTVRDATVDDAAGLVTLWCECVEASAKENADTVSYRAMWTEPTPEQADIALKKHLAKPDQRLFVAEANDRLVGVLVGVLTTATPVSPSPLAVVSDAQVAPDYRRRSVMSLLLARFADFAEQNRCDTTMVSIPAHARGPNRFLAKIGFNQVATVRAIPTGKLRARLATASDETSRLVAVRRTLRRRDGSDDDVS